MKLSLPSKPLVRRYQVEVAVYGYRDFVVRADKHFVAEDKKIGASAYVVKSEADISLVKAIKAAVIGSKIISLV